MLAQRAGVGVAFGAARNLTGIRFGIQVCSLMLCPVAGVAESFLAAWVLTQVRLLPSVTPEVNLKVLKPRKCLVATFKHALVWFFSRMNPHMNQQFVTSIEGFVSADTACPKASEVLSFPLVNVRLFYVSDQFVLLVVSGTAVNPPTDLLAIAEVLFVPFAGLKGFGRHRGVQVRQCPLSLA